MVNNAEKMKHSLKLLVILLGLFLFSGITNAATINWIGAGADENWTTGGNQGGN